MSRQRYEMLDFIRGFTVLLMIIFHFSFDLDKFGFVDIDFIRDPLWWAFPRVIVFLFFIAVGMSLALVHQKAICWRSFWQRFAKLCFFAVCISVGTYFMFPKNWIYFGTLHSIALGSVAALPLIRKPYLALSVSILLIAPSLAGFKWPFFKMAHHSLDYIPLLPWLGVITFGIFLYHRHLHTVPIPQFPGKKTFIWLGKNALVIYLLHQPILFSAVYFVKLALR